MSRLADNHLRDLRSSGLSDETIAASGCYSETNSEAIRELLDWYRSAESLGPCLVFPYRQLSGELNGFAMLKPDRPRKSKNKPVKYESPEGHPPKPYFTPRAIEEIRQPSRGLLITEGQKKSLAADQSGFPAIGLSGPFGWQKKQNDKSSPRVLIDDLAAIDWRDRIVTITFDTDPRHNSSVNHGLAELARVLHEHAAIVSIIDLPIGPVDANGIPAKMGIDDFIVAYGEQAFCEFMESNRQRGRNAITLDDYRERLSRNRCETVSQPGVYLDRSPTGSGKSYADMEACWKAKTSLTVQRTHKNCQEVEREYKAFGLAAAAYPQLDKESCLNHDKAEQAMKHGLSASSAICPACIHKDACSYRFDLAAAEASAHIIVTHHRAALCFEGLADGRLYVVIHEDASNLLRPKFEVASGLQKVATVADMAVSGACELFAEQDRATLAYYFTRMERIANALVDELDRKSETTSLKLPVATSTPPGADARLYRAMEQSDTWPEAEPMQLVKAIAAGEIVELVVRVDRIHKRGSKDDFQVKKSIVGFKQTVLPAKATTWICDATADVHDVEILAGRSVTDCTPGGEIKQRHPAIQIPTDIKQSTSRAKMLGLIRGVLTAIPSQYQRIGIICDRQHAPAIEGTGKQGPNLEPEYRDRIAKVEYFRNGSSRGSNEWLDCCDLLIVAGTPRVPPTAIKSRLIQLGKIAAASRADDWVEWGRDYWSGITQSGRRVTVQSTGYRDRDWQAAYRAIVAAELIQSVGRGRGICDNGIPVVVLSNEPLGLSLVDIELQPLTDSEAELLVKLTEQLPKGVERLDKTELTEHFPNIYIGNCSVSSSALAEAIGKTERHVRKTLGSLADRGLVHRIGQRGGWLPADPPTIRLATAAAATPPRDHASQSDLSELLADLRQREVHLEIQSGRLRYSNSSAVSNDLIARMRARKSDLTKLVRCGTS